MNMAYVFSAESPHLRLYRPMQGGGGTGKSHIHSDFFLGPSPPAIYGNFCHVLFFFSPSNFHKKFRQLSQPHYGAVHLVTA
jgi:hypothetical protein